jgi:formate/nitrite transporter FocA (FNT family)
MQGGEDALIVLFALAYTLCPSKFMTQQSKQQQQLSMRELLARFSVGAIIGGAMGLCYWLYITSFTNGWTKTATFFSIAWGLSFTLGCGLMAVKGKKLLWTFLDSLPPMP